MSVFQNFNNISSKILKNCLQNGLIKEQSKINRLTVKSLWGYVAIAFNRVDNDRLQLVGPDRLCAEWVIKNGGAISTVESPNHLHTDYNSLPAENHRFKVKVVDGSGSSIMKIGLDHFKGCNHIDTVIFHQCKHLEEDALHGLLHLKNTLKVLQVSACDNISDDGLMPIGELSTLELLKIFEMRYVKDLDKVEKILTDMLPKCHTRLRRSEDIPINIPKNISLLHNFNNISRKIFINVTNNGVNWRHQRINQLPVKSLWSYVAIAFNRVDNDRLQDVGPDRLCAEWVIKNGGVIRTVEASNRVYSDYNSLPPENHTLKVKVVDGSDSSIMKMGFDHFKGCNHIDTVILHTCKHLEKDGLYGLVQLKDTLKVLQVSDCDNIRDDGLLQLGLLTKLEELKIFEMRYVQDWNNVKQKLSVMLPKCHIDIRE